MHSRALRLAKRNAQLQKTIDKLFLLTFSARKEAREESDSEDVDDCEPESHSDALWLEAVSRTDGDSEDSDSFVEVEEPERSPRSRTRALPDFLSPRSEEGWT